MKISPYSIAPQVVPIKSPAAPAGAARVQELNRKLEDQLTTRITGIRKAISQSDVLDKNSNKSSGVGSILDIKA